MNIRSLGFCDIRECVTLWGLILRSSGCSRQFCLGHAHSLYQKISFQVFVYYYQVELETRWNVDVFSLEV
jgi:hypothetical protein